MKAGDLIKTSQKRKEQEKVDLLLVHCDLFYGMELSNTNLGLIYIASYLESRGYRVEILGVNELYAMSDARFETYLNRKTPTVTGFYVVSDNYELVIHRAKQVKETLPDTWVVFGGPLASSTAEEMIELPFVDGVVTGEGEYSMEKICNAICRNEGSLSLAEGLIYRKDGKVQKGAPPMTIDNLDELPFPARKYFAKQQVFQVVSGRGCPYKCTFCFQSGHGLKFRFRSAENVVSEIVENLEAMPFVGFDFIDDAFIMDPERCLRIAAGLKEYRERTNRDFIFFSQGRVNILEKHPEIIKALSEVGLFKMQLGIESGDPEVLAHYKKAITLDQVRKVVSYVKDLGTVSAIGGFILGGPFESEKSFRKTVDFAVEMIELAPGAFDASSGFLGAYPGTAIANNPEKFGLTMIEHDFAKGCSLSDVQFVTESFDKLQIRELKRRFDGEILEAMSRNLKRIPRKLLKLQYIWVERYKSITSWYSYFLGRFQTIRQYFNFLKSPRFREINRIPREELNRWYPIRVIEGVYYNPDGTVTLPPSLETITLQGNDKILIYELCAGKLNLFEIAQRAKKDLNLETDENELIENLILPFLLKLEETYHVIFHE